MTHTPGPWDASHDADGDYAIFSVGGILVCVTDADKEEDAANANLIAAAPMMRDLLEVLSGSGTVVPFAEAIGDWATKYGLSLTKGASPATLRSWAIETAIAKAGGQ